MNAYFRALAQIANAIVVVFRWLAGTYEDRGYVAPEMVFRYPTLEAAWPLTAYAVNIPTTALAIQANRALVSLRKDKAPNLVRPFVHARAVGRAVVVALDELGLPMGPMASKDTPGVGIFEQAWDAWKLRLTGTEDLDVSWA